MGKITQMVVVATGAAMDVTLGFIPHQVKVENMATRTSIEASAMDTVNTKGVAVSAAGAKTSPANGITMSGHDSSFRGFTLAAAATVNAADDKLLVTATAFDYVEEPADVEEE